MNICIYDLFTYSHKIFEYLQVSMIQLFHEMNKIRIYNFLIVLETVINTNKISHYQHYQHGQ